MIADALAALAIETRGDAIPPDARKRARLHLLDALGCGLAAVGTRAADHATVVALAQGGRAEASVLGAREMVPAAVAALANGTRCHGLDFDDTHEAGICHSSTVVGPAALAAGEAAGARGEDVLDAFVLGSEVALRLAAALADGLYARGFHPTSVCGAFGATAAAARLYGLSVVQARNALGIVGSFASGLFEYLADGSATKPLHAGWAAQAGVQAALLARAGATGPASVIEGRFGLAVSHTGSVEGLAGVADGAGWEIANVSIKPYPACHFAHASTWAAGELAEEHGLGVEDVAEIVVRIPAEGEPLVLAPLEAKHAPKTPYDGKFSLPFTVAHRLVHGHLDLGSFTPESVREEPVLSLARRVRGEPLPDPPSRFCGGARIVTRAGDAFDRFLPYAPGSPRNPLSEAWILDKFRANAALSLGPGAADEVAEAVGAQAFDHALALARAAAPTHLVRA